MTVHDCVSACEWVWGVVGERREFVLLLLLSRVSRVSRGDGALRLPALVVWNFQLVGM
jgi:hypothetical protein